MEKFTQEQLLAQREEIIGLLRSTNRKGIETLIKFLDASKYFFCWGSQKHHKYIGGLAEHSLQVCRIALEENNGECDESNIIIGGELFGLNSSCEIAAKVSSKTATFDQMVSGMYRLVGSAALDGDSITFKFDIKVDDKSKGYTRTAVKL